jgi:hypothetical protein
VTDRQAEPAPEDQTETYRAAIVEGFDRAQQGAEKGLGDSQRLRRTGATPCRSARRAKCIVRFAVVETNASTVTIERWEGPKWRG